MTLSNRREVLDHAKRVLQSYVDDATIDKDAFKQLTKSCGDACAAPISVNAVELYLFQELVATLESSGKQNTLAAAVLEQIKNELQQRQQTLAAAAGTSDAAAVAASEDGSVEASEAASASAATLQGGSNEPTGNANSSVTNSAVVAGTAVKQSVTNALKERMMKRRAELEASKAAKLKAKREQEEQLKMKKAAEQANSAAASSENATLKRARSESDEKSEDSASSEQMMVGMGAEGEDLASARDALASSGTATPSPATVSPALPCVSHPKAIPVANLSLPESEREERTRPKTRSRIELYDMQDMYGEVDDLYGDILATTAQRPAVNAHSHSHSGPAKLSNPPSSSATQGKSTFTPPAVDAFEYEDV